MVSHLNTAANNYHQTLGSAGGLHGYNPQVTYLTSVLVELNYLSARLFKRLVRYGIGDFLNLSVLVKTS